MGRKQLNTPRSRVKHYLRLLWLRSRERAKALKDAKYTCKCGKKQSRAKGKEVYVEVHHLTEIDWEGLIDLVFERLLNPPKEVLCKECHGEKTKEQATKRSQRP